MSGIVSSLHHNGAYSRCYPHFMRVSLDVFLLHPNQIEHQALLILLQESRSALSLTTIITSILSTLDHSRSFQLVSLFPSGLPEICTPQSFLSYSDSTLFKPPNSIGFPLLLGKNPQSSPEPPSPSYTIPPLWPPLPTLTLRFPSRRVNLGHAGFPFYPSNAP